MATFPIPSQKVYKCRVSDKYNYSESRQMAPLLPPRNITDKYHSPRAEIVLVFHNPL